MADEALPWKPLVPAEVAALFAELRVLWWIAGGWAIDLCIGHATGSHADRDVQIFRHDQLAVQTVLATWDLHAADPPGTLRPWTPGEVLPPHVHDVWCRPGSSSPWALQVMLADTNDDRWLFRRDPRVSRPFTDQGRAGADCSTVPESSALCQGVPALPPEG